MENETAHLFDIPPEHPGKTCKTCKHRMVMKFSEHAYISYCTKIPSRKTANGWLKIKSKNEACYRYEED